MEIDLCDILQASYGTPNAVQQMAKAGYVYDSELSSHNQQVWFRADQLIVTIAGTHNYADVFTDMMLGLGQIKRTKRYKNADIVLEKARHKYANNTDNTIRVVVAGHSLGGAIAQYIASKNDIVFTLNKGATIGQQTQTNEFGIRTTGDVVSLMSAGSTRMNTVRTNNFCRPLKAHHIENIRGKVFI